MSYHKRFALLKKIKLIESGELKEIAEYLTSQAIPVTYYGMPWTGCVNNWIYFDTCLELEILREKFQLGANIMVHENQDPRSGTERGFIDTNTGEALMGKLE